jgi:hypothetical protein
VSATATVSWVDGIAYGDNTIETIAKKIADASYAGWDVTRKAELVMFFPHVTPSPAITPGAVFGAGSTGVTATCTNAATTAPLTTTTLTLPHNYIAPGSLKLRIEFTTECFNESIETVPVDVTHTLLIKETRSNNQWSSVSYIKNNYSAYKDNESSTVMDYYNGYLDITEYDSVYYDSSALDDDGDLLPSYFKTQQTKAFDIQGAITINHITATTTTITLSPQVIREAFLFEKDTSWLYTGTGNRYSPISVSIYCTYNLRASQVLKGSAIAGITEVGLFNESDKMIAYGTFPPVIYDTLKHHSSFNFFITDQVLDPISI